MVRPLPCLALLVAGCAGSAPADFGTPMPSLERVEVDDDDDGRRVVGYTDDDGTVLESRMHVEVEFAIVEIAIDGDRFSVATSPGAGSPQVRIERDAWLLDWKAEDDAPLPEDLEARWLPVVSAWKDELVGDDGFLRPAYADAVNVDDDVEPIAGITRAEWASVCPHLTSWGCKSPSFASTIACEIAGAGFCTAHGPPAG